MYTTKVIKMNNKYCFVNIFESKLNRTQNEKFLLSAFLISLTTLSASEMLVTKDSLSIEALEQKSTLLEEKALMAIQTENYEYIEQLLQSGKINPE